ncbi:hypothetical protein ACV3R5_17405 [Clostridium perfringens]
MAEIMGTSRQWINRIKNTALKKLKENI